MASIMSLSLTNQAHLATCSRGICSRKAQLRSATKHHVLRMRHGVCTSQALPGRGRESYTLTRQPC